MVSSLEGVDGQDRSLNRKFISVWLGSIVLVQIVLGFIFWNDLPPISVLPRVTVPVLFNIGWLPFSFLLIDRLMVLADRSSRKIWGVLCALPALLMVAFLLSVSGIGISELLGSQQSERLISSAWGWASASTLLSIPVYFAGCIWLYRRLRKIPSVGQP